MTRAQAQRSGHGSDLPLHPTPIGWWLATGHRRTVEPCWDRPSPPPRGVLIRHSIRGAIRSVTCLPDRLTTAGVAIAGLVLLTACGADDPAPGAGPTLEGDSRAVDSAEPPDAEAADAETSPEVGNESILRRARLAEESSELPAEEPVGDGGQEGPADDAASDRAQEAPADDAASDRAQEAPADDAERERTQEAPADDAERERAQEAPADASADDEPEQESPTIGVYDRSRIGPISEEFRALMERTTWQPGCPVAIEDLRQVTVRYVDFADAEREGEVIVHADVAEDVLDALGQLYERRFPIERIEPIEHFDGDDDASMAANNTSAFNCRPITGSDRWSEHAYGWAIDINPIQNPYERDGVVLPPEGEPYLDRADVRPGMLTRPGAVEPFDEIGWGWGGDWTSLVDYMHLSLTGR